MKYTPFEWDRSSWHIKFCARLSHSVIRYGEVGNQTNLIERRARKKIQLREKKVIDFFISLILLISSYCFLINIFYEFWMKINFWLIFHSTLFSKSVIAKSYFFIKSNLLFFFEVRLDREKKSFMGRKAMMNDESQFPLNIHNLTLFLFFPPNKNFNENSYLPQQKICNML